MYYSPPPYTALEFIGAVANTRPSDIFYPGFPLNPDINNLINIKIALKILPLA